MPSVLYEKAGWYMIEGRIEDRRIGGRSSRASVVISSSGQVWGGKGREREREKKRVMYVKLMLYSNAKMRDVSQHGINRLKKKL